MQKTATTTHLLNLLWQYTVLPSRLQTRQNGLITLSESFLCLFMSSHGHAISLTFQKLQPDLHFVSFQSLTQITTLFCLYNPLHNAYVTQITVTVFTMFITSFSVSQRNEQNSCPLQIRLQKMQKIPLNLFLIFCATCFQAVPLTKCRLVLQLRQILLKIR